MTRALLLLLLVLFLFCGPTIATAQNPFLNPQKTQTPQHSSFLNKISSWQRQLKMKMTVLVKQVHSTGNISPLLSLLLIAFGYGALHAAGPGHGKAVAVSLISSKNATFGQGIFFGSLIAFCHGFSGILCVLALYYVLKTGISGPLTEISRITRITSFSLIILLGLGIIAQHGRSLFFKIKAKPASLAENGPQKSKSAFIFWAVTVGIIPCPGVIMVMLFCLAQGVPGLGLLLALAISLGMATTIALVVGAIVVGRKIPLAFIDGRRAQTMENIIGLLSGFLVTTLGLLFLVITLA